MRLKGDPGENQRAKGPEKWTETGTPLVLFRGWWLESSLYSSLGSQSAPLPWASCWAPWPAQLLQERRDLLHCKAQAAIFLIQAWQDRGETVALQVHQFMKILFSWALWSGTFTEYSWSAEHTLPHSKFRISVSSSDLITNWELWFQPLPSIVSVFWTTYL